VIFLKKRIALIVVDLVMLVVILFILAVAICVKMHIPIALFVVEQEKCLIGRKIPL
jgi:hypothetical protein